MFSVLLILLHVLSIRCEKDAHHEKSSPLCTHRYEHRLLFESSGVTCQEVRRRNPVCKPDLTIAYSPLPPYVFVGHDSTNVTGILPGMLQAALDSCCMGCTRMHLIGPMTAIELLRSNTSLSIPIQTSINSAFYSDLEYIHILQVPGVSFLSIEKPHDARSAAKHLLSSVLGTWPLFVLALCMAIVAGMVVWVLDSWFNEEEFPKSFPRGPLEGFWWAFVSMTTVGYGDRAPKSVVARLFAVLWILLGITIFSMYTASLTSALTATVVTTDGDTIYEKKIAVLNTTSVGKIACIRQNAKPITFSSLDDITNAILRKDVSGVAMDANVLNYFKGHLYEALPQSVHLKLAKVQTMDAYSYGMISHQSNVTKFFRSFFESNDDFREVMAHDAVLRHEEEHEMEPQKEVTKLFYSSDSFIYYVTMGSLVGIAILTVVVGLLLKWLHKRRRSFSCLTKPEADVKAETNVESMKLKGEKENGEMDQA